jgi:serine/threonine-protein phosphatase 4 catalytic subunit
MKSSLDIDRMLLALSQHQIPNESEIEQICFKARELFMEDANIERISSPATICGDIHGQFDDLLELFRIGGDCPDVNYVFLGDYVDRGNQSVETFLYLICLKIKYP